MMMERSNKAYNVDRNFIFNFPKQSNVYLDNEKISSYQLPNNNKTNEMKFEISDTSAFVKVKKENKMDDEQLTDKKNVNTPSIIDSIKFYSCTFPELTEGKETKKLSNQAYTRLYEYLIEEINQGKTPELLYKEHPQVDDLRGLPGTIYFLKVQKGTRRPPRIGFQFRSYSECHYTTVDRENPIICKVKVRLLVYFIYTNITFFSKGISMPRRFSDYLEIISLLLGE